jgi:hypothetical protein
MRQGEDDVAVGHREQLLGLGRKPPVARRGLALGTTARTTRVIGDDLLLAGIALLEVSAESGRAACADCRRVRIMSSTRTPYDIASPLTYTMRERISALSRNCSVITT